MKNLNLYLYLILYFVFIVIKIYTAIDPKKVMFAMNCGGDSYTDPNGIVYEADDYYNSGNPSDYGVQYDIDLTKDEELYQTERWADRDLIYTIPFDVEPGTYVIVFKFSEVYFSQANEKIFDIALGSKIVVKNLDIFEQVGKAKAHDEFVEFEIKQDGNLYYKVKFKRIYSEFFQFNYFLGCYCTRWF